jgi:radical SAM superfamily enzyme YgiQ (UPF0313 family)
MGPAGLSPDVCQSEHYFDKCSKVLFSFESGRATDNSLNGLNRTMRVLLINPFYPISETPSPPLGLAYLAAALEAVGAEVRLLDYVVYPFDRPALEKVMGDFNPNMVGATAVTMTVDNALSALRAVKEISPRMPTVMGGPHVTFAAAETLQAHPELDLVVLGEGEQTIVELLQAIVAGSGWEAIQGISYRRNGRIRMTPSRPFIQDLNRLPMPARRLLPLGRYRALRLPISMTTSRGCPFQCIFCVGRRMVGAKVRYRNPVSVVDEMQSLAELDFHQINLADDLFTANKAHCLAVCDEIERRRLDIGWTSFARVDTVSTDLLRRMRRSGCTAVSFGIESGDPAILKTIKKGITLDQVAAAVEMCIQAGVAPYASFILGLPGETEGTIERTLQFGEKLKAMGLMFGFHLLAPFPGTEIRERHEAYGIRIVSHDWSEYHANRAIVETEGVSRSRLNELIIAWEAEYDAHLSNIAEKIAAGRATPDEADQLIGLERTVMIYDLMMGRSIERHGSWRRNGQDPEAEAGVSALAGRLTAAVGADGARLKDALSHAIRQGDLTCTPSEGRITWKWRDHL